MEEREVYRNTFKKYKCCVIIPTYNNATTLQGVIQSVLFFTDDILVVNDGATDETPQLLDRHPELHVLTQPVNKGKGFALRSGFKKAMELGYAYAITIDSDGQHNANDIPRFLEKLEQCPDTIVVGARNMEQSSVPGKSSFGHKFSNFWFWFETGISLPDTQSGFRLYPLESLKDIRWFTYKYEFEIEVLVRAAWKGVKIGAVPVSVYYAPKETRISHFRPFKDFSRVSVLNVVLVFFTLIYIKPLKLLRSFKKKNLSELVKTYLLNPKESDWKKTCSVMLGIFMGILPVWGFQLLLGIPLAHFLRLNKVIFVMAAHISIPPMIPLIIFFSYVLGGGILGKQTGHFIFSRNISLQTIEHDMFQYVVGGIALSVLAALLAGGITYAFLKLFPLKRDTLQAI